MDTLTRRTPGARRPVLALLCLGLLGPLASPENFKSAMNGLTKRAARLDTVLNATRLDSP